MKYKYIERIWNNVQAVNLSEVRELYYLMKEANCIIPYGSGRSFSAIKIPMSQYAKMSNAPVVITPEDVGFPGNNMYEALKVLSKKYRRVLLVINSGSGESEEPLTVSLDFARFVRDNKDVEYKLVAITSKPDSSIGRIAKEYGLVVKLEGRKDEKGADFTTTGIMGDSFELGSLLLLQAIVKTIYLDDFSIYSRTINEFYARISELISYYIDSDVYEELTNLLTQRSNVFIGGRGSAHEVATMLVIRLNHIKYAIGDHVYRARGSNTPRPRPGDVAILISCSGETPIIVAWAENLKSMGTHVFAVVGNRDSKLAKVISKLLLIEENVEFGKPRDFYMYSAFLLSPLPIKLIEKFNEMGLILPESLLRYYHSTIE